MTREQMYAVDPAPLTPDNANALAAHRAWQSEVGEPAAINAVGELSGINALLRGASRIGTGMADRRPLQAAAGAGEAALGLMPVAGMTRAGAPVVNALFGTVPRAAASSIALAAPMAVADAQAQTKPPQRGADQVRELQQRLRDAGYYRGPIDGVMGPATADANAAFEAAERARQAQQMEMLRLQTERDRITAQADETARLREEADTAAARKAAADARVREVEENVPTFNWLLRNYGPLAGTVAGTMLGGMLRAKVVSRDNRASRELAEGINALMATPARDPAARAAMVNEVWARGGAREMPFRVSDRSPRGFVPNPTAPPAADLYRPPRLSYAATDVAIPAAGMVEFGIADQLLSERARAELQAAQQALAADPSEANIKRVQTAKDQVAAYEALANIGRSSALGYGAAALKMRRSPAVPDRHLAEQERMRLSRR
jgi:hypothetical protein